MGLVKIKIVCYLSTVLFEKNAIKLLVLVLKLHSLNVSLTASSNKPPEFRASVKNSVGHLQLLYYRSTI